MSAMRTRLIIIGSVHPRARLTRGGQGCPFYGWWINWRGRTDWCQPNEFAGWEPLLAAVRTRLKHARLRLVEVHGASMTRPPAHDDWFKLLIRVARLKK